MMQTSPSNPTKVLFLDIDGVLIPARAYLLPNQTKPFVKTFDPVAVALLNDALEQQGRKIVLHSSWIKLKFLTSGEDDVVEHCIKQGIKASNFSSDPYCDRDMSWRYDRVDDYLKRHPEIADFLIIDDEPLDDKYVGPFAKHFIHTDFEDGIQMKHYLRIRDGVGKR